MTESKFSLVVGDSSKSNGKRNYKVGTAREESFRSDSRDITVLQSKNKLTMSLEVKKSHGINYWKNLRLVKRAE